MPEQRFVCADCGLPAPSVNEEGGSTLITVKYGWRLTRRREPDGQSVIEARCATCWSRKRASHRSG